MDKEILLWGLRSIAEETGFELNEKKEIWMPMLKHGEYRSAVAHGQFNNRSAVIKVSPYEDYQGIATNFKAYNGAFITPVTHLTSAVRIPDILLIETIKGLSVMIQESVNNAERVLSHYPKSTRTLKKQVAKIYWDTRKAFCHSKGLKIEKSDCMEYFMSRYSQYTKTRIKTKTNDVYIDRDLENKAFSFIFDNSKSMKTQASFSHFSNTDIVKSWDQCYIVDATIVPRPEMYEAAFWLWGATMHAYNIAPKIWIKELEKWAGAFIEECPYITEEYQYLKLNVCLVERMLGTLMIDLPLRRSPFDKLPKAAAIMEANLSRSVIEHICAKFP